MDALASFERVIATPRFIFTVIVAAIFIGGGIYLLSRGGGFVTTIPGAMLILMGITSIFSGWIRRTVVRNNRTAAAVVGVLDVARLARGVL